MTKLTHTKSGEKGGIEIKVWKIGYAKVNMSTGRCNIQKLQVSSPLQWHFHVSHLTGLSGSM
jgi:hypothetical protein